MACVSVSTRYRQTGGLILSARTGRGCQAWKQSSGYYRRSLAETAISRFKRIWGPTISARTFPGQAAEIKVRCNILNIMTQLGTPASYLVI